MFTKKSSIKTRQLVDLKRKMSGYDQSNVATGYSDIGAEWIKPMEYHITDKFPKQVIKGVISIVILTLFLSCIMGRG